MTIKLVQILTDLQELITSWNSRLVSTEKEFIEELKQLSERLSGEVEEAVEE